MSENAIPLGLGLGLIGLAVVQIRALLRSP
jgi:hypothetical protein